jgi:pimeloyl-ACP methyl ester carboxylesterase
MLAGCDLRERVVAAYHGCGEAPAILSGPNRVIEGAMHSRILERDVAYAIAFPRERARAIVFVLPGRGERPHDAMIELGFSRAAYGSASSVPLAVAAVDGGETYWHGRASGGDASAMFAREFVPFAERVIAERRSMPEAIVGDSMGGYGALLVASEDPKRYRAVAIASPAIWTSYPGKGIDAFDGPGDYARNDIYRRKALRSIPLRIDRARHDPFAAGIAKLAKLVPGTIVAEHPGCHDDAFFASVVDDQLRFVSAHVRAP